MKRKILLLFLGFVYISAVNAAPIRLSSDLVLNKINDNVLVVTHSFPWESNSLVLITEKSNVVLVDTPYTNEAMEKVYAWVKNEYKPRKVEAIITGYHIDNIGGVEFLKNNGVMVIGSELSNGLIRSESGNTIRTLMSWLNPVTQKKHYDYYSNVHLVESTKKIKLTDIYVYRLDNIEIELFYPGESHAKDNITAYITIYDVLFGSCIVKSMESKDLGFTGDANMENWPNAVRTIMERYKNSRTVIPHHGNWGGMELLDHTLGLFVK